MKKALSLVLALIMLLSVCPLMSSAADIVVGDGQSYTVDGELTIEADSTLTVAGVLTVTGTLTNYGEIRLLEGSVFTVAKFGVVANHGSFIREDGSVFNYEQGTFTNYITLPSSKTVTYSGSDTYDRQNHNVTFDFYYLPASAMTSDTSYTDKANYTGSTGNAGNEVQLAYGDTLYIMPVASEDGNDIVYIDTGRMQLNCGGTIIDNTYSVGTSRGVFKVAPTQAAEYQVVSYKYTNLVKQFRIDLPAKEGAYTVTTDQGESGSVLVNYGKTLTVHVDLAPEYDESDPLLYVSSVPIEPDDEGYFDINACLADDGITTIVNSTVYSFIGFTVTDDNGDPVLDQNGQTQVVHTKHAPVYYNGEEVFNYGIQTDVSLTVMGVMKNETMKKLTSVFAYIREVFETLKDVFGEIFAAIKGIFESRGEG